MEHGGRHTYVEEDHGILGNKKPLYLRKFCMLLYYNMCNLPSHQPWFDGERQREEEVGTGEPGTYWIRLVICSLRERLTSLMIARTYGRLLMSSSAGTRSVPIRSAISLYALRCASG